MDQSFPDLRRLRKRREFLAVQQHGRPVYSRHFVVLVMPHEEPGRLGRLGITVSKRVGCAVTRNRIKRLIREFVRRHPWLPASKDVVVIAKANAKALTSLQQVEADLSAVGSRL